MRASLFYCKLYNLPTHFVLLTTGGHQCVPLCDISGELVLIKSLVFYEFGLLIHKPGSRWKHRLLNLMRDLCKGSSGRKVGVSPGCPSSLRDHWLSCTALICVLLGKVRQHQLTVEKPLGDARLLRGGIRCKHNLESGKGFVCVAPIVLCSSGLLSNQTSGKLSAILPWPTAMQSYLHVVDQSRPVSPSAQWV